jgi:hypothetical protein
MDELGAWQPTFGSDNAKIFQTPPAFALYAFAQAADGKLLGMHERITQAPRFCGLLQLGFSYLQSLSV